MHFRFPSVPNRKAGALLAALALVSSAFAADPPAIVKAPVIPAKSAAPPERVLRIDRLLQRYTDEGRIPGAVALVLRDGKPVYEKASGYSDKEAGRRMTTDTIFRIASQTKAITTTAILMLVEEGKIALTEPVYHFIPTFASTTVAVKEGGEVKIVPAKRRITIHDLMTHTAGISYGREAH